MSNIITTLDAKIFLELTEGEARALDAMCAYGTEEFKEFFYKSMGKSFLQPVENHLGSLFTKARSLRNELRTIENMREQLKTLTNE